MTQPLRVLIAEDNLLDAELIVRELRRAGFDPQWTRADSELDYLAQLNPDLDIILSDFVMPQFGGIRALELLKNSGLDIPFIIISGTIGEDAAVAVMKQGATDYLLKDRLARLGSAVRRAMQEVKERTERERLKSQFIEAQKMEVMGQLAAGIAHDFNNILSVIIGNSDMISMDLPPDSPSRNYNEEIKHASEYAAGLTRQLLIVSRKQPAQLVVLDLNDVVRDMEKLLRRLIGENINMTISPSPRPSFVKADAGHVGQVLMNLVVNARDAMGNGGRLVVTVDSVCLDESFVISHPGSTMGDNWVLSVSDTGTGITEAVKARLFEPLFTTKPLGKGTGLGLATCQTIVQQSGGHIDVLSELGSGSTFKVYFPSVLEVPQPPVPSIKSRLPRGTETLLIVEDHASVRLLIRRALEALGYQVLTAGNGQEALDVAQEHHGAPIALVISDIMMPLMDGKIMAEKLSQRYPGIKILLTSGYTGEAVTYEGVPESGVEFLAKPYGPGIFARKVRTILDRK